MKVRKSHKKQNPSGSDLVALANRIVTCTETELPSVLKAFDCWVYPRSDLHVWINVLDRFDDILADITKSYGLSKLQTNDFTPKTKELLLEILRVQRLLLENCTNRKLFASYDRLCDLLLTSDLDVLHATIFVLLRPAQQYANQTPMDSAQRHAALHRLLTLSRGWEKLTSSGTDLTTLATTQVELPADLAEVSVQYYPSSEPSSSTSVPALETPRRPTMKARGASTLDLGNVGTWSNSADQLTTQAEAAQVPLDDQYVALNKIRLARAVNDLNLRRQLLTIRLLALATYVYISNEDAAQSGLFLYEPELVPQIADLIRAAPSDEIITGALLALDACAHHRAKTTEVMTAVSANVNHGILISFLRQMVDKMIQGVSVPYEMFDASIAFIAYISTSPIHNNMLMGAGILRLLLDMLGVNNDRREQCIPRASGLLDSIIFSANQGMSNFSGIDGVNSLVSKVKAEIERRIAATDPLPTETLSEETILVSANNPLRGVLRPLQRLMQAAGGTEGLRNLVDSDLPKCLRRIFETPAKFGPRVFALAINTMATFVHNEPTSLSILQELRLPQTLFTELEKGLPPSYEVIGTISNAIGAVCLNQAGLDFITSHPGIITSLVNVVSYPTHETAFGDRENPKYIGASLDELSRHHPLLRPIIMKAVIDMLQRVIKDAETFEPKMEERREYILEELRPLEGKPSGETPPVPNNTHLATLARTFKMLSGLTRNAATTQDFVKEGGLIQILKLADLPCLPIRFGPTDAASALAHLLKHVGEHSHTQLIETIVASTQEAMGQCRNLCTDDSLWAAMDSGTADEATRSRFKTLRGFAIRLTFLTEALFALSLQHSRIATSLITMLNVGTFIQDLGEVHRMAFRQHVLLRRKTDEEGSPADDFTKASGAKYLATRLHTVLGKCFRTMIKLLHVRRNPDAQHIQHAREFAKVISSVIITDLGVADSADCTNVALSVATMMLYDGRGTDGHINTTLFLSFIKEGGLETLLSVCRRILASMDKSVAATAGVKLVLLLLGSLASPRSLVESPETHALEQRPQSPLKAIDLFVKIRLAIIPLAYEIWQADWLLECPLPIIKLAVKCFAVLMQGKTEEPPSQSAPAPAASGLPVAPPVRPPPVTADPARVEQLVDMGFPRPAAERALIRARNNVAAATDLILSMPHVFQEPQAEPHPAPEDPQPPPQPAEEGSSEAQPDVEAAQPDPAPEPEIPATDPKADREALSKLREEYRQNMSVRALALLDHAEDLVFEILPCFPSGTEGTAVLLDHLLAATTPYDASKSEMISARLRLVSVHLRSTEELLEPNQIQKAASIFSELPLTEARPKWLTALFLFAETIFVSSFTVTKVKIGDDPIEVSTPCPHLTQATTSLASACYRLIALEDVTRDEQIAALRLLVILTRFHTPSTQELVGLLKPFRTKSDKLTGSHGLLLLVLRHAFEDRAVLTESMRREVRQWFTRSKVVDINHFVRQLRQAALRDPTCFAQVVEEECALVDPTPPQSVYHIRNKEQTKDKEATTTSPSDPFQVHPGEGRHPLVDHLVLELGQAVRASLEKDEDEDAHTYAGLLMSVLCELLGSYTITKKAFLASVREQGLGFKIKGSSSLITDLVCCVSLSPDVTGIPSFEKGSKPARRLAVSSWSSSLILALCADTTPNTAKDVSEDMIIIRKTVIDAISRCVRDSTSMPDLPIRYGRLWALGEVIYRLLTSRPVGPRQPSDATLHVAKLMLEKNYVSVLTNAIGEIDLNYPDVKNVLVTLLRALDHLSKLSVKYGKAKSETKTSAPNDDESSSDSDTEPDSDIDMIEDDSAPDLYRNSALGMIGGELGDEDDEDEEDDEDDEMDMGDDMTDEEDGTDIQTSEDESMGSELDPENWEDELEEGSEGDDQEVILGSNEEEDEWEDADGPDENESLLMDENEEEEMLDDEEMDMGDDEEGFFDDDIHPEIDLDDEEEYDEVEMLDSFPSAQTGYRQSPDVTGPWGWQQPSRDQPRRNRSILAEDPAVSLFGAPPTRVAGNVAQHPLISDPTAAAAAQPFRGLPRTNLNELLTAIEGMGGSAAVQALEDLISSRQHAGPDAIRISFSQDMNGRIGLSVDGRTFSLSHPHANASSAAPGGAVDLLSEYAPVPTMQRWQEEMNLATTSRNELTSRLVLHIVNRLMPEARRRADEEEAKNKKADEEAAKAAAEEQNKQLESASEIALPESGQPSPLADVDDDDADIAMEDEEGTEDEEDAFMPTDASLARTIITIHGRDVDITDTGIDLEFLQALPDDMRADVVEQHMREQARHQRPANPSVPESASQINPEFLDALPPEIRAEVIMHEALESARRQDPAPPAAVPAPAPPALPANVQGAGFLASLSTELRGVMMMDQLLRNVEPPVIMPAPSAKPTPAGPHREAMQLLEKPGIASLVRLLFFPETLKKGHLFRVLVNLCENTTTRTDLLNLLLSVVQDGSGDLPAVDRSFQQMSLKGVTSTPKATPKASSKPMDSPAAAAVVPTGLFSHLQTEHVPTFIAQRCFEALAYIVNSNAAAVTYFLTEHEQPVGLRKQSKKGKGKPVPQTKYPIVVLLGLLDRPLLAKTPGMMETVTALLGTITKPLTEKDKAPQPVIPPPVLRLIVNCLTSGECTSRTFRQTLVVMQNLACLPEAKEVILQELRTRCRDLGGVVHEQLTQLASSLDDDSAEIGSLTLVNFAPPTSSQAQLLRLLKTIDYLHLNNVDSDPPTGSSLTDEEKSVSAVFESFDFEPLWVQLGQCLSRVEARGSTEQIATVLLPLVEALMVVCKYRSRFREVRSPSVPSNETDASDLFVSFTTTHRKVLNAIVRNNPSLLSGSFSLLIRNPRVLEFDNKRNWFFQKLRRKRDDTLPSGTVPLNIRRQYVFEDSFHALQRRTGDEIKYGKLSVKFYNEDGVDAGGVTREWYSVLAQQIFDPNFALFEPCAADQQTFQPNKASSINTDHLAYFKFVGRVIGKAVYDGRLLDAYFNRAFYKQILGRTVDMRDLESIDPEYHKSLQWMLDNDITGVIDQEFTIEDDQFGEKKVVELKPGGASIPVTEENKEEYVRLVVSYRLDNSIKDQIKAFLEGFYDIIPRQLIQIFEPDQLELLISGITTVDVDELKNATQLSGWKSTDPEIQWFWRALRSFSQEERSRFLMFVTSSSRVPLGGFAQLQGSSGIQPFQIQKLYAKEGGLPQASTCFNLLLLPTYASYEQLRERLQFAIVETGGFGKA
ncbi:hypothetical protein I317_01667 [Kwoniella heveanensis CBS 569]|nr:hypothetical protein I317_01667 [Kwoniella heveanensis CBS 569]